MENATFENLPRMVHDLQREIHELKKMISNINAQPDSDDFMGVEGVCSILGITFPTVYALLHNGKSPSYKLGKRLYFFRSEILEWVKANQRFTIEEVRANPQRNLKSIKVRGVKS